jgi:hypothetical protein
LRRGEFNGIVSRMRSWSFRTVLRLVLGMFFVLSADLTAVHAAEMGSAKTFPVLSVSADNCKAGCCAAAGSSVDCDAFCSAAVGSLPMQAELPSLFILIAAGGVWPTGQLAGLISKPIPFPPRARNIA